MIKMKWIPYIIITALVIYIFLMPQKVKYKEITRYDTIVKIDSVYVPEIVYRDTGSIKTVLKRIFDTISDTVVNVDTIYIKEIVYEHFTKNYYSDTLLNDKDKLIVINDTIFRNKIIYRNPVINISVKNKGSFFYGATIGGNKNRFIFAPQILYSKNNKAYGIGYDVINQNIQLNFYMKW